MAGENGSCDHARLRARIFVLGACTLRSRAACEEQCSRIIAKEFTVTKYTTADALLVFGNKIPTRGKAR